MTHINTRDKYGSDQGQLVGIGKMRGKGWLVNLRIMRLFIQIVYFISETLMENTQLYI